MVSGEDKKEAMMDKEANDEDLRKIAEMYVSWETDPDYIKEVKKVIEQADNGEEEGLKHLRTMFHPKNRIAFGTAGLRSKMAAGYNSMNSVVVRQASQGLAAYVELVFEESCKSNDKLTKSVVIGHDARYHSEEYAEIAKESFLQKGFTVHFFRDIVATPLVPYGVNQLNAAVGVMVTASHNPKDDNGYKVYWNNGAQIISPIDQYIAKSIMENLEPWDIELEDPKANVTDPYDDLSESYMASIKELYCFHGDTNKKDGINVCYTAMHGVGTHWVLEAFKSFDLSPPFLTKEQCDPDPDFPTVAFPNPEEGKGALKLALQCADDNDCPIVIANDPDADRLAAAEKQESGEWKIFNGNEIAALFADWVWTNYKKNEKDCDPSKCWMIASTVSSKFIQSMAKTEGFNFRDTLTGFKWIGNAAVDVMKNGDNFLFAYEVEIGFLVGNISVDKDGVRTAAIFAEMAGIHYQNGKTLTKRLEELRAKYGYYEMTNSYFFCYDSENLLGVFDRLRNFNKETPDDTFGSYVTKCGKHNIVGIRDVTTGFDSDQADGNSILTTPDSQMLTFRFENGTTCTVRNSGTEPKLKYYVECNDKDDEAAAKKLLKEMTDVIIEEFLQPDVFHLVAKK